MPCLSESVEFLSFLEMYLPVFLVLLLCVCVCVCHGAHRQTNRHSREISEIVTAHMRACAHAEITRTPLSFGGDECDADSLSLLIQTYIDRHTKKRTNIYIHSLSHLCGCVYIYICSFFVCFSEYTLQLGVLTHCFSSIQGALFIEQPVVSPATGHFCRAFIASVSVCVPHG
jgi:hypothetical protein